MSQDTVVVQCYRLTLCVLFNKGMRHEALYVVLTYYSSVTEVCQIDVFMAVEIILGTSLVEKFQYTRTAL